MHMLPQLLCFPSPLSVCLPGTYAHVDSGGNQQTSCEKSLADSLDFYTWFWEGLNGSVHKAALIPRISLVVCGR